MVLRFSGQARESSAGISRYQGRDHYRTGPHPTSSLSGMTPAYVLEADRERHDRGARWAGHAHGSRGGWSYFAKRSLPRKPQELTSHNCVNLRLPTQGGLYAWEFEKG